MKRMKTYLLAIIAATTVSVTGTARVNVDRFQSGNQQLAYPVNDSNAPALTASPEGYEPFHLEHYGRHGSRWLIGPRIYQQPVEALQRADSLGHLTDAGRDLLERLRPIAAEAPYRDGELTPLGHRQHREIARRLMRNFPEMFTDNTVLDAKSTMVIRCILSMTNEVAEIEKEFPDMIIRVDASLSYQDTLNPNHLDTIASRLYKENRWRVDSLQERIDGHHPDFLGKVFKDVKFATDSLEGERIYTNVFDIAVNSQSHDNLYDIYDFFTEEELQNGWEWRNVRWYLRSGNTSLTDNRTPYALSPLLRNFITSADTAVVAERPTLNMRFGHESMVLPLTVLMELGDTTYDTDNLDTLADHWQDYSIFPMASNIQMVFYRPTGGKAARAEDVLVKVLLNEAEMTLAPALIPVSGPYYRWTDVRKYYLDKINSINKKVITRPPTPAHII